MKHRFKVGDIITTADSRELLFYIRGVTSDHYYLTTLNARSNIEYQLGGKWSVRFIDWHRQLYTDAFQKEDELLSFNIFLKLFYSIKNWF